MAIRLFCFASWNVTRTCYLWWGCCFSPPKKPLNAKYCSFKLPSLAWWIHRNDASMKSCVNSLQFLSGSYQANCLQLVLPQPIKRCVQLVQMQTIFFTDPVTQLFKWQTRDGFYCEAVVSKIVTKCLSTFSDDCTNFSLSFTLQTRQSFN